MTTRGRPPDAFDVVSAATGEPLARSNMLSVSRVQALADVSLPATRPRPGSPRRSGPPRARGRRRPRPGAARRRSPLRRDVPRDHEAVDRPDRHRPRSCGIVRERASRLERLARPEPDPADCHGRHAARRGPAPGRQPTSRSRSARLSSAVVFVQLAFRLRHHWHQHHLGSPPAANSSASAGQRSGEAGTISMPLSVGLRLTSGRGDVRGLDRASSGHGVAMPMGHLPFAALAAIDLGGAAGRRSVADR